MGLCPALYALAIFAECRVGLCPMAWVSSDSITPELCDPRQGNFGPFTHKLGQTVVSALWHCWKQLNEIQDRKQ